MLALPPRLSARFTCSGCARLKWSEMSNRTEAWRGRALFQAPQNRRHEYGHAKVAGVVRMVGSVVEDNPIIATPASSKRTDAAREVRVMGNAWRSPMAKKITKRPLVTNAAVIM